MSRKCALFSWAAEDLDLSNQLQLLFDKKVAQLQKATNRSSYCTPLES